MNIDDYGLINLVVTKDEIDNFKFDEIYNFLIDAKEDPLKYYNKLNMIIHGYDNDARELCEIHEVRNYFAFLDRSFPYWFYFINVDLPKKLSFLVVLVTCLCEIEYIGPDINGVKFISFNLECRRDFILNHFGFMNEIMDKMKYPEKEIKSRSKQILSILT